MKKVLMIVACLCLLCSAAFAEEDVLELNWAEIGTDELVAMGEFQQIEIPDVLTVVYWLPSVMKSVDVSVIDGPFKPTALYSTEDQKYSLAIFVAEIASLQEYATTMESQGGGSSFRNVKVNGVDCISYEVAESAIDSLIYPVTENVILSFNFTPLNGDDDWDATKAAIVASIQPAQ